MSDESLVSIIIPTFNRKLILFETLKTIFNQSYDSVEIIIIDDCSSDGSIEILKDISDRDRKKIQYINNQRHLGSSKCWNIGLENATGEYVFLTSDDVPMDINCIQNLISAASGQRKNVFFPRVIDISDISEYGKNVNKHGQPVYINIISHDIKMYWDVTTTSEEEIITGHGAPFFNRSVLSSVGLFHNYPVNGIREETDYCNRLRLSGYRLMFLPQAVVYHIRGCSGGQRTYGNDFWTYFNVLLYLARFFPTTFLFRFPFYFISKYLYKKNNKFILRLYHSIHDTLYEGNHPI